MTRHRQKPAKRALRIIALWSPALCGLLLAVGCSSAPPQQYKYSTWYGDIWPRENERPNYEQIEANFTSGQPVWVVDNLGHYVFSIPGKLLLWDRRVGDHKVSAETAEQVRVYLIGNDLCKVKVRLNEYAPFSEFARLWNCSEVSPAYRATIGLVYWLKYTVLPDRLLAGFPFFGDNYNPYTNTISIYSDNPVLALQMAALAKNYAVRQYKGSYALLGIVPGFDFHQQYLASRDVAAWDYLHREKDREMDDYRTLMQFCPTYFLQPAALLVGPIPAVIQIAASYPLAGVGRLVARKKIENRMSNVDPPGLDEAAAPQAQTSASAKSGQARPELNILDINDDSTSAIRAP
jgi:hypothetical protein